MKKNDNYMTANGGLQRDRLKESHMANDIVQLISKAKNGDVEAQFQLGTYYHGEYSKSCSAKDLETCIHWYTRASEQKHTLATTNLAICYYFGDGVVQNYELAFGLFSESADHGDVNAKYYVGLSHLHGHGATQDSEKGFAILLSCAEAGMPWAQLSVADCYKDGIGVTIDLFEAVSWYYRAADQGSPEAGDKFNRLYYFTHFFDSEGNQRFFWFEEDALRKGQRDE